MTKPDVSRIVSQKDFDNYSLDGRISLEYLRGYSAVVSELKTGEVIDNKDISSEFLKGYSDACKVLFEPK